ncbi:MAG: hypothetical protein LUD29_02930 [Clostridia bacterium]|nr:hypothetical protein [Clostridia bacterium]
MSRIKTAWNKTVAFIKRPLLIPVLVLWVLAIVYFVFFFGFLLDMRADTAAIVVYCLFPVVLFLVIYTVIVSMERIQAIALDIISRFKRGERIATDYTYRVNFFSSISTIINIFYVIYNLVIACVMSSVWYASLTVAYVLLVGMRVYCLDAHRRQLKTHEVDFYRAYGTFMYTGIALVAYAAVFSFAIVEMFTVGNVTQYPRFILYVVIGYTIYKAILSVFSYIRASRYRNPVWRAIRHIAIADCIVSVVSLFYSMLYEMIAINYIHVFNVLAGIIGIAGAVSIAWVGIFMIYHGVRGIKATKHLGLERIVHMDDLLGIKYEWEPDDSVELDYTLRDDDEEYPPRSESGDAPGGGDKI